MKEYTIENEQLSLTVIEYGARIHKLVFKDSLGEQNLVHSLGDKENYLNDNTALNAVVGRFAGRICSDVITIDNKCYPLQTNNGVHLHGGKGFSKRFWTVESISTDISPSITLSYLSKHLEDGYPGNLKVCVTYSLKDTTLNIDYSAITDQTTIVNLTHHAYFKLDDTMEFNHLKFKIPASKCLEMDNKLCPNGNLIDLKGTSLDFNTEKELEKQRLDTVYVIDNSKDVEVYSPHTTIKLKVCTNQKTAVVYTPDNKVGFCIETQNYANSPNCKNFPSSELKVDETYKSITSYQFLRE